MKKLMMFIAVALMMSSCATPQLCPAYKPTRVVEKSVIKSKPTDRKPRMNPRSSHGFQGAY